MEKLLTLQEAADIMSMSIHTIRKWVQSGRLPSKKIGVTRRIEPAALRRFIDGEHVAETVASTPQDGLVRVGEVIHATR